MHRAERYELILLTIARALRANGRFTSLLPATLAGLVGEIGKVFIEHIDAQPVLPGYVDAGDWQHRARIERAALMMVEGRLQTASPEGLDDITEKQALVTVAYEDAELVLAQADNPSFAPVLLGGS